MSQNSLSTGSDYEHQVSYGLEVLEGTTVRENLRRQSYQGQNSSPNFVTNPLLHLDDLVENENNENSLIEAFNKEYRASDGKKDFLYQNEFSKSDENCEEINSPLFLFEAKNPFVQNSEIIERKNPLYELNDQVFFVKKDFSENDRDSGPCSIDSEDFLKTGDPRTSQRLCYNFEKNDNACTPDGRKYWSSVHKFHTFGGIKRRKYRTIDEDDLELSDDLTYVSQNYSNDQYDLFAGLKFQTFGGIKKDETNNRVAKFRRQKIRTSMRVLENRYHSESNKMSGIFKKSKFSTTKKNSSKISGMKNCSVRNNATSVNSESLRLERPRVPEVVQTTFQTLLDIRQADKSKRKNSKSSIAKHEKMNFS